MNEKDLFESKEFQCIDPKKLEIMKQIAQQAKGKNPLEIVNLFSKHAEEFSEGKPLSAEEKNALLQVMRQSMSEQERKTFDELLGMLRSMGKL